MMLWYYKSMENINGNKVVTKRRYEIGEYDSGTGTTRTYFRYFNTHNQAVKFQDKTGHDVKFVKIDTFYRHTLAMKD